MRRNPWRIVRGDRAMKKENWEGWQGWFPGGAGEYFSSHN